MACTRATLGCVRATIQARFVGTASSLLAVDNDLNGAKRMLHETWCWHWSEIDSGNWQWEAVIVGSFFQDLFLWDNFLPFCFGVLPH
jgi:hypothetical protein